LTSDNPKLHGWREVIGWAAREATGELIEVPCSVAAVFYLPRPASIPKHVRYPGKRPDLDKLIRACLDAMTGIVFKDDSLVVTVDACKRYVESGHQLGVQITVGSLSNDARVAP
jgi:Holliday junction resolvase RusA-like endonuclease